LIRIIDTDNPVFVACHPFAVMSRPISSSAALHLNTHARVWGVVPCGGTGSRAGGDVPKQYRPVAGLPMVAHTLSALAEVSSIGGLLLAVAPGDEWHKRQMDGLPPGGLPQLPAVARRGSTWLRAMPVAGESRAHTVYNSLQTWRSWGADERDWVLVHDAARCLATPAQIYTLIDACLADPVGGLLALPLPDTLKQGVHNRASVTVVREDKWLAQTPQMFRLGELLYAMEAAKRSNFAQITDEASAMEIQGQMPLLVQGSADNFKVTYPTDFALAQAVIRSRTA